MMDDVVETKPDVSRKLDEAVASVGLAAADASEFNENPSWLLEDIRELKQLERLKLIRAVPEGEQVYRPRSSKRPVACDYDQLPDVLVHSKAEALRGKSSKGLIASMKKSSSAASVLVSLSREEAVQHSLDELRRREQLQRARTRIQVRTMSSCAALPRASVRYLQRRQQLSSSPGRGTAAFCTHETVPRPQTAPNRTRGRPTEGREAFIVSSDDAGKNSASCKRRSPSPDRFKNSEEERRQRVRMMQTVLVGWWYAKNLKLNFDSKKALQAEQEVAVCTLQLQLRKLMKRRRVKNAGDVVPACLRRAIIRYRRRKYIGIVKNYLIECAKNQKSKIIKQFLYRVRRLQRLIKNWLVTQRARAEVMRRYWERVEFNYRKGLADDYRAAQELLIENERKLKKRARAPIAELWSKTNTKVCKLLKKVDRVQLKAAREKAFEDNTEIPQHTNGADQMTLGEFEGSIADDVKTAVIRDIIKSKREMFLEKKKMEKIAATQALSSKSKVNEELVRRMLSNYRSYANHVVRVQLVTMREVARQQRDRFTRAQNVCFLTNQSLGPLFKAVIEGIVLKDIHRRKAEEAEAERAASANRLQRLNSVSSQRGGILKKSKSTMSFGAATRGPESDAEGSERGVSSPRSTTKKVSSPAKRKKQVRVMMHPDPQEAMA